MSNNGVSSSLHHCRPAPDDRGANNNEISIVHSWTTGMLQHRHPSVRKWGRCRGGVIYGSNLPWNQIGHSTLVTPNPKYLCLPIKNARKHDHNSESKILPCVYQHRQNETKRRLSINTSPCIPFWSEHLRRQCPSQLHVTLCIPFTCLLVRCEIPVGKLQCRFNYLHCQ